jgi:hypothetical protein
MNTQTVADAFAANDKIAQKFESYVTSLGKEQADRQLDGERWTVAQIVEHVAHVEDAAARICSKLLEKAVAVGTPGDGSIEITPNFFAKGDEIAAVKVEAPERVHPVQGRTIDESLAMMAETRQRFEEMRPRFENYDCREHKFPHPFFGDISAAEWLVLSGGHKARHLKQIQRLVDKM